MAEVAGSPIGLTLVFTYATGGGEPPTPSGGTTWTKEASVATVWTKEDIEN